MNAMDDVSMQVVDRLTPIVIMKALNRLADELAKEGEFAGVLLLGGAAIVLMFGAREATKDVDFVPIRISNT